VVKGAKDCDRAITRTNADRAHRGAPETRPRTIDDAQVDAVTARTLETVPENATHWSMRGMARAMGVSQTAVCRIWHAFGLQPHCQGTFKLNSSVDRAENNEHIEKTISC
jgi:hypothetical protein